MEGAGALADARAAERVINALDLLAAETPDGFLFRYWDNIRQDAEEDSLFREFSRVAVWKANQVNCTAFRQNQLESRLNASDENAKKCRDCQHRKDRSLQLMTRLKTLGAGTLNVQTLPDEDETIQRRCRYHEDERNYIIADLRGRNWNWVCWAYDNGDGGGNGDLELLSILSRSVLMIRNCIITNLGERGANTPIDRRHARYCLDNMYRYFRCLIRILADFPSLVSHHRGSGPRGAGDPVDVFRLAICLEQRAHRCAVLLYEQCYDDLELCKHSETEKDALHCHCEDYSNLYAAATSYMMASRGRHVEPGLLQFQDWIKQLGHQLEVQQQEAERRQLRPASGSHSYGRSSAMPPPRDFDDSSSREIAILLVQELMRSGIFPDFHQRSSPCGRARHDGIKAKLCHMLHILSGNEIRHQLRFNEMEEMLSFEIDSALLLMEGGSGNGNSPPTLTEQDLLRRLVVENSEALTSPSALSRVSQDKRQMLDLLMGESDRDAEHRCADYVLNKRVLPVVESIRASFAGNGGIQEGPLYSELHNQVHMAWQGRDRGPPLAPVTASHHKAESPGALVRGLRDQVLTYCHTPNRWVEWDEISATGITKFVGHIKEVSSCGNWLDLQYAEVSMPAADDHAASPGLFGVRSVEATRVKPFPELIRQSQENTMELFAEIHLLCEDARSQKPAERESAEGRLQIVVEDTVKRIAAPMLHHLRGTAMEVLEQLCTMMYLPPTDFRKIRSDLQDSSDVQRTAEGLKRLLTIFGGEGRYHMKGLLGQRYAHCRCSMTVAGLPAVAVIMLNCPVFPHDLVSRTLTVCQDLWARDAHASLRAIAVSAGVAPGLAFSLRKLKLGSSTISVTIDSSLEGILSLHHAILAAPATARVSFTGLGDVSIQGMWLKAVNVYKDSSGVMDSWVPVGDYAKDIGALLTKLMEEFSGLVNPPFFDAMPEACWEGTVEDHADPMPPPDSARPPPQPRQQQKQQQPQQQNQHLGQALPMADAATDAPGPSETGTRDRQHEPDGSHEASPMLLRVPLPPEIRTPGQVNEWFNGPLQTQFPGIAPREFGHFGNKTHMWRTCCRLCCARRPEDPPHLRNPPNLTKGRAMKIVHSAMGRNLCPPEHILVKDAFRSVAIALTLMTRVAVTPMRAWRFFERSSNQLICQSQEFARFLEEKDIHWPPFPPQIAGEEPPPNPRPLHHDNIYDQQLETARTLTAARAAFKRRLEEEEERLGLRKRSE